MRFIFLILILTCAVLFSAEGRAYTEEEKSAATTEWPLARLSLALGPGGFYSSSSNSAALLFEADASFRIYKRLRLGLMFNGKAHPWNDNTSFFGTSGALVECDIWRGLFADVAAGPAWNLLKSGSFQESAYGWGVLTQFGWRYSPLPHFTLEARAHFGLRDVRGLYLDYGLLLGPGLYF